MRMAGKRAGRNEGRAGGLTFLLAFFGFLALLSLVALVRLGGNPVFLFTLLLCVTSVLTVWRLDREEAPSPVRRARRRRA